MMQIIYTANLITIKNNNILLVKRNFNQEEGGLWSLPGGTKKHGENIKDTLAREIDEELGVSIKKMSFFKEYKRKIKNKTVIASYFIADIESSIKLNKKELSYCKWFEFNKVPNKLAYLQNEVLKDYLFYVDKNMLQK